MEAKHAEKQEQKTTMKQLSETKDPEPPELDLRPWADLPSDILEPISSLLLFSDCFRFPAVCKSWQAIKVPRKLQPELPWFVSLSKTDGLCTLFDTSCNRTYRITSPNLIGATINSSKSGWLLLSKPDGNFTIFSFFNPLTRKHIDLPRSQAVNFKAASFSAPPTSSECAIVIVQTSSLSSVITIHLYNGDGDLTFDSYKCRSWGFRSFLVHPHTPVFSNGFVFFAGYGGKVGVFHLENRYWTLIENPMAGIFNFTVNYMAEYEGEVLLVSVPAPNRPVQVMRVDKHELTLDDVTGLGDWALFVSPKAAMMTKVQIEGMRNKIHYPVIGADRLCERVGSFSMDSLKYEEPLEMSLPMEVTKFLVAGSDSTSWAWIEPEAFDG